MISHRSVPVYAPVSVNRLAAVRTIGDQWCHQDLLRGGAKLEIMSWGTHGGLQGRVQQLLDD